MKKLGRGGSALSCWSALCVGTLVLSGCDQHYQLVQREAQVAPACRPVVGSVEPREARSLRWRWEAGSASEFNQTMSTPMVADIDGDGVSDFVFTSFLMGNGKSYSTTGILRVVSGADGTELWSTAGREDAAQPYGAAAPAVYDLDRDGSPEILVAGPSTLLIFGAKGAVAARFPLGVSIPSTSRISVADVDFDGRYEILIGMAASTHLFRLDYAKREISASLLSEVMGIMDVDPGSAGPEIITSGAIYSADSTRSRALAVDAPRSVMAAFGNFDDEPDAEIVFTQSNPPSVSVFKGSTGALIRSWVESMEDQAACRARTSRTSFSLGAPNVGDIDGDGRADITFAGACWFRALRNTADGLREQWKLETRDFSSSVTGSSVFDFNGDGRVEVLYNDELFFRILDGRSGEVIYALPNDNGTLWENPVVVSLRPDEPASIVLSANSYTGYSQKHDPLALEDAESGLANVTGLRVIQGGDNLWMPTRTLWNQFDYLVTQVLDNLQVPGTILDFVGLSNHTRANIPRIVHRCE